MARNLLDLAADLNKQADSINESASALAAKVALTIVADLAYKTPVDSSQALSSWIVTLDQPSTDKRLPFYPGEFGSTQTASAQETINSAKAVLANKKPGRIIFITNNQPYIKRLNEGYSSQAPAGFVERAILIGERLFKKFSIKG